jgi:hypothetical protein
VAEVAERIAEERARANGAGTTKIEKLARGGKDIEELLRELDQLSEEEAEELLAQEMGSQKDKEADHE